MILSLVLLLIFSTLWDISDGNINVNQVCPVSGCLQCISSQSSEVERCQQLYFLITETNNHEAETELYCTGNCPIILATANFYCFQFSSSVIQNLFRECSLYTVLPTGKEDINVNGSRRCTSNTLCDGCIYQHSNDALKCLQHYLLMRYTNNTQYRRSFCEGNCPLTLRTSEWYCGASFSPFLECRINGNKRYCAELEDEIRSDSDFNLCRTSSINACPSQCVDAMNKYGCCLALPSLGLASRIRNFCSISTCNVETGGSPSHLATPLLIFTLLVVVSATYY